MAFTTFLQAWTFTPAVTAGNDYAATGNWRAD